jgi:hypothetical protein
MRELNPDDVIRHSERLRDGRRFIRCEHRPTGAIVEAFAERNESLLKLNERLWQELSAKVLKPQNQDNLERHNGYKTK